MPPMAVPPEFLDIAIDVWNIHVLRALRGECVADRAACKTYWGAAGSLHQVLVTPPMAVPPELVDAPAKIDYMLAAKKHVSNGGIASGSARDAGCGGQVMMMPARAIPEQFMHVVVAGVVGDVL